MFSTRQFESNMINVGELWAYLKFKTQWKRYPKPISFLEDPCEERIQTDVIELLPLKHARSCRLNKGYAHNRLPSVGIHTVPPLRSPHSMPGVILRRRDQAFREILPPWNLWQQEKEEREREQRLQERGRGWLGGYKMHEPSEKPFSLFIMSSEPTHGLITYVNQGPTWFRHLSPLELCTLV